MDRPKIDKPRIQNWLNDDEQLSSLLDHIEKKVLNVSLWKIYNPQSNKYIDFQELAESISKKKYPDISDMESIKGFLAHLPEKFRVIKDDLYTVFKKFLLNLQERVNYIEQANEYIDYLESQKTDKNSIDEIDKLKKRLEKLEKPPWQK